MNYLGLILFFIAGILVSQTSWGCSVCFGDPNSAASRGVIAALWVLLGVTLFVLGGIASLIVVWSKKAGKIK